MPGFGVWRKRRIVDRLKWSWLTILPLTIALVGGEPGIAKAVRSLDGNDSAMRLDGSDEKASAIATDNPTTPEKPTVATVASPLKPSETAENSDPEREAAAPELEARSPVESESQADLSLEIESESDPTVEERAEQTEDAVTPSVAIDTDINPAVLDESSSPPPTLRAQNNEDETGDRQPQVLVSEVVVRGPGGREIPRDLQELVYDTVGTQPGRTTTSRQLQEDVNAVYATGFFGRVEPLAEETPLGVRVIFEVLPNPTLNRVTAQNNQVLTQEKIDEIFGDLYGDILNLREFQRGIETLNQWYQTNGYVLAQVIDPPVPEEGLIAPPPVSDDGVVTLDVAEGRIEDIDIRFLSEEGELVDEDGEPVDGRTREFIITREMRSQPGEVLNRDVIQQDLQRIFGLGLFEDVNLSVEPGTDPRQAVLVINVIEGSFGSIAAGGGFSSVGGFFGTVSFQEQNLGGNDQILGAEVQLGTRGLFFDVNFTDPWIGGDPYRTAYNINLFRRRSISLVFDSGPDQREVELDNGDRPRIDRIGGAVTFTRPLTREVFNTRQAWTASLGLEVQEVTIRDADGDREPRDEEGNLLSASEDGTDFIPSVRFGIARDRRNNPLDPTRGYRVSFSTEQAIPFDADVFYNRLRGSYSYYFPVDILNFTDGPEALAFNVQAGTIIGDMPPYEAFVLGGVNSVRGYAEGALGTGRSFVQATAEYRFPIFSILSGVVFLDVGTDLGTGENVPGDPAGIRDKPGSGFGYGAGIRVQSPIGPIRIDFGINDDGENRFHFGIGQRF